MRPWDCIKIVMREFIINLKVLIMKKILICSSLVIFLIAGCSSTQYRKSDRCLSYSIAGDNVPWKPKRFYQDESSLYIEIPSYVKFTPKLNVIDTEYGQRLNIPYTYNPNTHMFRVEDNYNEYILTTRDVEEFYEDSVTIKCNRQEPIPAAK